MSMSKSINSSGQWMQKPGKLSKQVKQRKIRKVKMSNVLLDDFIYKENFILYRLVRHDDGLWRQFKWSQIRKDVSGSWDYIDNIDKKIAVIKLKASPSIWRKIELPSHIG
jgi:hypothetical protein